MESALWSKEQQLLHINILELLAIKVALLTLTNPESIRSITFQIDTKTAISYLLKIGGCGLEEVELWVGEVGIAKQTMIALLQEIWEVQLKKNITISASRIPSQCPKQRGKQGVTKQQGLLGLGTMLSYLSKTQVSVQSPDRSISITSMPSANKLSFLETKTKQQGSGYNATKLVSLIKTCSLCLPAFSLVPRVLRKIVQGQVHTMILVVPIWKTQPQYPRLLQLLITNPIIIPHMPNLQLNSQKEIHPIVANKTLRLAAWNVSENL